MRHLLTTQIRDTFESNLIEGATLPRCRPCFQVDRAGYIRIMTTGKCSICGNTKRDMYIIYPLIPALDRADGYIHDDLEKVGGDHRTLHGRPWKALARL